MKKILVIGAGFVGSQVVEIFSAKSWDVKGVSLSGSEGFIAGDVSDFRSVKALPDADVIIHCASSGRGGAEGYRRVYRDGAQNLIDRFPDALLLFTSSTSVYSQTSGEVVDETSLAEPDRETGMVLLETEKLVLGAGGIVARLAGIYGPGRSALLRKFQSGEAKIEEDGRRMINQIHRDDAASAIVHLVSQEAPARGEIYNVSDGSPMSQLEVYQGLAERHQKPLPESGPRDLNRKRGWTNKSVSNQKLRAIGWSPAFPTFFDALGKI